MLPFVDFAGYEASALPFLSGTTCRNIADAVHTMAKELLMRYIQLPLAQLQFVLWCRRAHATHRDVEDKQLPQ